MKKPALLLICLLLLFSAVACSAESPEGSSLSSAVEDVFSETEDALMPEAEEAATANVPSAVAKEGGKVLIYNGEVAAEHYLAVLLAQREQLPSAQFLRKAVHVERAVVAFG